MIKKILNSEIFFAALALTLIVVVLSTRSVEMSRMVQNMMLGLFTAAVLGYAAFIYKEQPADEREYEISLLASKHAYVAAAVVLSAGIVVQSVDHTLDPWLPSILGTMVIVKSISYFLQNK